MNRNDLGPRQLAALDYIAAHPGCTKYAAGRSAADRPTGRCRMEYMYRPVNRLIELGLVVAAQGQGNAYSLTVAVR